MRVITVPKAPGQTYIQLKPPTMFGGNIRLDKSEPYVIILLMRFITSARLDGFSGLA